MPLEILGPMVVLGIAGIALALHLLGLTAPRRLTTKDEARAAWLREHPDDDIAQVLLARSGRAALITLASGARGLVYAMGADTCAHPLKGARWQQRKNALRVGLPDFAAPHFDIALAPDELPIWLKETAPK